MTDMQELLAEAGYTQSEDQVWGRAEFASIAYSDGDASEAGLLRTLRDARDVSVFSPELRAACTDWPSFYHLSNERANLLRPFSGGFAATTRVLEIGAGCGAVTRFLGETGAQVLALEGSRRRAAIARQRARGLENVHVLAERFQDFAPKIRFDAITLIGVLEYASVFSEAAQPALEMLGKVRAMLAPGGSVYVAIENRFGLKYLAGAPEDHLGAPMVGVEGRYSDDGVRTWGRAELETLLADAGFARREFYVPMPDYKTPTSIIGPRGLQSNPQEFDAGTLAAQAVRRDRQLGATTFNLQRAWAGIADNRLLLDLGNSFLVRAGDEGNVPWDDATLAWHYSTQRARVFARESRFVREDDGHLTVRSRRLSDERAADGDVRMCVSEVDAYHRGPLLVEEFRAVLTRPGWTLDDVANVTTRYLGHLRDILEEDGAEIAINDPTQVLPDGYIDATPFNLVSAPEGRVAYFDREWEVSSPTLGWLTLRSLLFTYAGTAVAPMELAVGVERVGDFVRQTLARVFPGHGQEWVEAEILREGVFQSAVTGTDQRESLRKALDIPLGRGADDVSSGGGGILLQQLDLVSQSLHKGVAHVGDRIGSALEQQDAMSQSLHKSVAHVGDRIGSTLEQQDAMSQSLHKSVALVGDRVGSVLEQQDAMSQSLHRSVEHVGDRVGSVLEQQDAMSQSLHKSVVHVGDRVGSVLEQQDAMSQSLHKGMAHVGERVGSVLEQQDATSQSLHAGVAQVGERIGSVLEQQDAISRSLHAGVAQVGDRVGSVLEQQDVVSQSMHAVLQGINGGMDALRSDMTVSGRRLDGLLEQLDAVSQSLHAVTRDLAFGIQGIQRDVVLANERADGLLKQLDAVSQSLHAVAEGLSGSVGAVGRATHHLSARQLATWERLESVSADLHQLKQRSFGGVLRRILGWFRRSRP